MLPSWLPRRDRDELDVEPASYALPPGVPALQSDPAVVRLRYSAGLLLIGVCGALAGSHWEGAGPRREAPRAELRVIRSELEAARAHHALARLASIALVDRGEDGRRLAEELVEVLDATERADDLRRLREALVARAGR